MIKVRKRFDKKQVLNRMFLLKYTRQEGWATFITYTSAIFKIKAETVISIKSVWNTYLKVIACKIIDALV